MRLPSKTARYEQRVRFGRYVISQLKLNNKNTLVQTAETVTANIKTAGRHVEDLGEPVQDAMARRDYFDNLLDTTAKEFRLKLASGSLDATKTAPYTQIFPQGIDYYVSAPLGEVVNRYKELVTRL